jgi:hypothetical protein
MSQFSFHSPFKAFLFLASSFFVFGCASTYKPVTLNNMVYMDTKNAGDSLKVSYRFGVQQLTNNRRYAKKEIKHNLAAVAVKIENVSTVPLSVSRSTFKVGSATGAKVVYSPMAYSAKVKQRVGLHMLHALWGPWGISWREDEYGSTDVKGYYIPVGLIVGIGNAVRASNANKKHLEMLNHYEIWNKEILPGESLYGIISISTLSPEERLDFYYGRNLDNAAPSVTLPYVPKYPKQSSEFNFYVRPTTGTPFDTRSKIYATDTTHYVLFNGRKVYPRETESLSRLTASGKQFFGRPFGNKWLFKVIAGKINGYFFYAEDEIKAVSHIQKGDGPILDFSPDELLRMINDDPDALDLIMRGKYVEAIVLFNSKSL